MRLADLRKLHIFARAGQGPMPGARGSFRDMEIPTIGCCEVTAMTAAEEIELMNNCAAAFEAVANHLVERTPADNLLAAMSLGLAATRMLHQLAKSPAEAMEYANVFATSSLRSMADIVSGQETETAGLQ